MTQKQILLESLIIVSIGKVYSEQSTLLTNELPGTEKRNRFDQSVKYIDKFIKHIEDNLTEEDKKFLQDVTDAQLSALADMRQILHEQNQTNQ